MLTKAQVTLGYLINYCNFTKYLHGEFQTILRDSANGVIGKGRPLNPDQVTGIYWLLYNLVIFKEYSYHEFL